MVDPAWTPFFWQHIRKTEGCWEWQAKRLPKGYGHSSRHGLAHRYSWELHFGPIPEKLCVLHHCDNPPCVRPDHLFLGTVTENNADMKAKGRSVNCGAPTRSRPGESGNPRYVEAHARYRARLGQMRHLAAVTSVVPVMSEAGDSE